MKALNGHRASKSHMKAAAFKVFYYYMCSGRDDMPLAPGTGASFSNLYWLLKQAIPHTNNYRP